jgi:hypothetical protein
MKTFKIITKQEAEIICDHCGKDFKTPVEQSERFHIDNYDFHKSCILKIINNSTKCQQFLQQSGEENSLLR